MFTPIQENLTWLDASSPIAVFNGAASGIVMEISTQWVSGVQF